MNGPSRRTLRSLLFAGVALLSSPFAILPAHAQIAVFDASNFAENVLTAARELQQVNNEIQGLENQATMLINQAKNLASLPYSTLAQLDESISQTQQLPAASLPSDRRSLTRLGHVPSKTGRVMAEIMSEWVLCSDGRLYHPGLAKLAIDVLDNANRKRQKTAPGRAKLAEKRASVTEDKIEEIRIEDIKEKNFVLKEKPGRLPKDWQPSDADRQFAADLDLDIDRAADDFRDWWAAKPGKDGVRADWSATWRGWCRRRADKGETLTAAQPATGSIPSWSL